MYGGAGGQTAGTGRQVTRVSSVLVGASLLGVMCIALTTPSGSAVSSATRATHVRALSDLSVLEEQIAALETQLRTEIKKEMELKPIVEKKEECDPTTGDKYSDPWRTSWWLFAFGALGILSLLLLYGQMQEIRGEVGVGVRKQKKSGFAGLVERVVDSIRCADTFKQLCAYDPFKDPGQAPSGNAYRLLAVVGPSMARIEYNNKDGQNDTGADRTDGGFKATLPNLLGYLMIIMISLCILVMQLYFPYTLLLNSNDGAVFIGFKVTQYYFDFPSRLGLELVPLTLMSAKFFVKVEKVVREEFNQCLWLYKAISDGSIKFQILGKWWSHLWVTVSLLVNVYIAVCMTFYVVIAICTYGGGDIMTFFLKVLGSLGLISFDDDIMGALPQWSGWYAEHTNAAGHPQGGHPAGAYSDFFSGPELVRKGGDRAQWGERLLVEQKVSVTSTSFEDFEQQLGLNRDLSVRAGTRIGGVDVLSGMVVSAVDGAPVSDYDDVKGAHAALEHDIAQQITLGSKNGVTKRRSLTEYGADVGVTFSGRTVTALVEGGIAASAHVQKGAQLVSLHGHPIEDDAHVQAIVSKYVDSDMGDDGLGLVFKNQRHKLRPISVTMTRASAGLSAGDLKKGTGAKIARTKFIRVGLQFEEEEAELGFRLSGTMISAVEAHGVAAHAVDMGEVQNGLSIDGEQIVPPYQGEGQPHGRERQLYYYKGRNFGLSTLRDSEKPPSTGLEPGMFIVKINGKNVNSFDDIMYTLRGLKGDDVNYNVMRYDERKAKSIEGTKEWTGEGLTLVKRGHEVTKEFTMTLCRAGDEDSDFDDFVHGFVYMLVRIMLLSSLLFILVSYWEKDCKHVGV